MEQAETQVAYIRIDNLPPGKTWRQVKYLVGGMIHHSSILQVKMLPPVQSIVPPFIPFQSSIVSLKRADEPLNRLLLELNGYMWEYYRLVAYAVPPLHTPSGSQGFSNGAQAFSPHSQASMPSPPHSAPPMLMPFNPMQAMFFPQLTQDTSYPRHAAQQHGKKMRQVFSKESFRRQMSARGMCQLLLEGFPPCLHWDVNGVYRASTQQSSESAALKIATAHPEHFGKLKWTVLKDFIKLKCHNLLEMDSAGAKPNTREFYVGVYEDSEMKVDVEVLPESKSDGVASPDSESVSEGHETENQKKDLEQITDGLKQVSLEPDHRVVSATIYKAIVGFHSRELCEMCIESLQDQEYSLGYKLKVTELPALEW